MDDTKPDIKVFNPDGDDGMTEVLIPLPPAEEEELAISDKKDVSSVWAVKIPRFLLERWEMVEEGGVELGALVIDNSVSPARITLRLTHPIDNDNKPSPSGQDGSAPDQPSQTQASSSRPSAKRPRYDTSGIPDEYTVHVPSERAKNTFVFTEKKRVYKNDANTVRDDDGEIIGLGEAGGSGSGSGATGGREENGNKPGFKRKREKAFPRLIAKVDHECQMQPLQNQKYLKILEQRRLESEQSKRPVMRMDDTGISQAEQNQLASGYRNATSTFGSKMIISAKQQTGERHARLERHELIDRIFGLFKEKPYWGIPALKTVLKQPDSWLREVLRDVAVQIKEGQYMNMWELKRSWKDELDGGGARAGAGQGEAGEGEGDGEGEGGDRKPDIGDEEFDEDEEDDEEEDDFEEVMA